MTKKDYVRIAGILRSLFEPEGNAWNECLATVAREYAEYALEDNHLFDHLRFYAACGLDDLGRPVYYDD